MTPILRWSLWARKRSTIFWMAGVSIFMFINMIFYPSFKNDAEELQKSFENLPDAAVQLFGGSTDFFSPVGFLNSQIFFIMLPLLLIILAIGLGSALLAKEEQEGTIELLLARPVSRSKLLLGKALAGVAILTMVTLAAAVTIVVTAELVALEVSADRIILASVACYLLALSIGAIAFCVTSLGRLRKSSIGIASMVALGGYLLSSLVSTVSWLETPSKIFPFYYYDPEAILRGNMDWLNLLYFVVAILVAGCVSWFAFRRRDIG